MAYRIVKNMRAGDYVVITTHEGMDYIQRIVQTAKSKTDGWYDLTIENNLGFGTTFEAREDDWFKITQGA